MAKKKVVKKKKVAKKKKPEKQTSAINEDHRKLINTLYNIPSGLKRRIYYLWDEKIDDVTHFFYRINFHNLTGNAIEGSIFVNIEEAKKILAFIEKKSPVKRGQKRRIFPTTDPTWFNVFIFSKNKKTSKEEGTHQWVNVNKEDLV